MRVLIALLTFAIAAPAAPAGWRRVDSPHFIIVGDASADALRATAAKFEGFREALRRVLPAATTSEPVPTVVVVFPTDAAFTPFKPLYHGKTKTAIAGYATAGLDVNYIAMRNDGGDSDRLIFHEYTHMIVANAVAKAPVWLNEGLAEFYSTFALVDGGRRAQIGRPVADHLRRLNGTLPVPLTDLLKVDIASPVYNEDDRASGFYAESWALTHMLISDRPSRVPELGEYLRRVSDGASEIDAWQQVFGTQTEADLRRYLRRRDFATTVVDLPGTVAAPPSTDEALSPAEAAAFLAALQLRHRGPDVAAQLLEPALDGDPSSALANVTMAQIALARGDGAGAATRLTAMTRTGDWFTVYKIALALAQTADLAHGTRASHDVLARASRLLAQVRRSRPDLANIPAELAKIAAAGDDVPTAAAFADIARARALAPGRIDYALTEAELFADAGDFDRARSIIGPLLTSTYPEDVRNSARRLMAGLVELEKAAGK
ncbi:MAG TPA: DUF1570 domain-containing protein [Vicinamibacterales bacterium]|nr:DUF1570 domain-containing protein [Vicinamibacterales bacterium]